MKLRFKLRALLMVAVLLATMCSTYAQQSTPSYARPLRKAPSFTFVSPNTRENLTLAEAIRLLNSREELQLVNDIRRLTVCLGLKPIVLKTIGSSTDGAEHSALFRVFTDQPTVRYADARLGKLNRQKSVLNFSQNASGEDRLYILHTRRGRHSLASISRTLDRSGVAFRTLVPTRRRSTIVYVVDLSNELRKQVASASRQLGARLVLIRGTGEFIGDDEDRDRAQEVFGRVIKEYEDERPEVARKCSKP